MTSIIFLKLMCLESFTFVGQCTTDDHYNTALLVRELHLSPAMLTMSSASLDALEVC